MILFLTPTKLEQRYIKNQPWLKKLVVGVGSESAKRPEMINRPEYDVVVLFGMCGLLHDDMPFTELYCLNSINGHNLTEYQAHGFYAYTAKGVTAISPIHSSHVKYRHRDYHTVDLESSHISQICTRPLIVLRYGIDYCDKKLVRFPFNWIVQKIQHYAAQREMNKILNYIWFGAPINV